MVKKNVSPSELQYIRRFTAIIVRYHKLREEQRPYNEGLNKQERKSDQLLEQILESHLELCENMVTYIEDRRRTFMRVADHLQPSARKGGGGIGKTIRGYEK